MKATLPLNLTLASVTLFLIFTFIAAADTVILNETFDTGWTAGTTLVTTTPVNGWQGVVTTDVTKGFAEISNVSYHSASQSLHLVDNLAGYSALAAYNLNANYNSGYVDFWMAQDSAYATTNFRVDFFTTTSANNFNLVIGNLGNGNGLYIRNGSNAIVAYNTSISLTATDWNNYRVTFDQASQLLSVSFNGVEVLHLSSSELSTITTIGLGKLQLNAGYSSGTNMGAYFDDIQVVVIPELPASALLIFGAITLLTCLSLHRKHTRLTAES